MMVLDVACGVGSEINPRVVGEVMCKCFLGHVEESLHHHANCRLGVEEFGFPNRTDILGARYNVHLNMEE